MLLLYGPMRHHRHHHHRHSWRLRRLQQRRCYDVSAPVRDAHMHRSASPTQPLATSGRLKMHDLKMQDWKTTDNFARNRRVWKMQDWKMTDNILANSGQNYGVWKMTDHVNYRVCFLLTFLTDDIHGGF